MDEVSRAITLAVIAIIGALITQILLRWDQTRRETRLRLLSDIRAEQTQFEVVAYKARHLILGGVDVQKPTTKSAKVDEILFGEVYRESRLVTLCAELESFGIRSSDYAKGAHAFRNACYEIVKNGMSAEGSPVCDAAVKEIREEIKKISDQTTFLAKEIHKRFSIF